MHRVELRDHLASADDRVVLTSVLDRVEEVGEVSGGVDGAHLGHRIRLSDSGVDNVAARTGYVPSLCHQVTTARGLAITQVPSFGPGAQSLKVMRSDQGRSSFTMPSTRHANRGPREGKLTRRSNSCCAALTAAASDTDCGRIRRAKTVANSA